MSEKRARKLERRKRREKKKQRSALPAAWERLVEVFEDGDRRIEVWMGGFGEPPARHHRP